MKNKSKQILQALEKLLASGQEQRSGKQNDDEVVAHLITEFSRRGLEHHLEYFDKARIKELYAKQPYLLIEYLGNTLKVWQGYTVWYNENEKVLQQAVDYADEYFAEKLADFEQIVKKAAKNDTKTEKLRRDIAKLEHELGEYANEEQIENLVQEQKRKSALLEQLRAYKEDIDAGVFEILNSEIADLSKTYGTRGKALEKLKQERMTLSEDLDHMESRYEQLKNHAKMLGNAREVLAEVNQKIEAFNEEIVEENQKDFRKIYVQLDELVELGKYQGHDNITEELNAMKQRLDGIEKIFAKSLKEKSSNG